MITWRVTVVPLTLIIGATVAACASLIGINDRSLEDGGATGDDAAAAQNDGSLPEAARADGSYDSGTGADAPTGPSDSAAEASFSDRFGATDAPPAPDAPAPDASVDSSSAVDAGPDAPVVEASTCPDPCLLASGLNHPFLMAVDSNNVYWTEFGDVLGSGNGSVKSCPVGGCPAGGPNVIAQGLTNPRGIALDAQNVYFATATYGGVAGAIWKCAIAGCNGSPTPIGTAIIPFGLAVDSTSVYWVDLDDGSASKVDKGGAVQTQLYDGGVYDDAGDTIIEPGQCAVDGPYLYLMDRSEDALRISIVDGTVTYLGSGFNGQVYGNQFGITTSPTNVYFGGNGILVQSAKSTPGPTTNLSNSVATPVGVQYDTASGMIYWANYGSSSSNDGTVGKIGTDGGGQRILQASLTSPEAVAVGNSSVFWISNGTLDTVNGGTLPSTGAVWRTTK